MTNSFLKLPFFFLFLSTLSFSLFHLYLFFASSTSLLSMILLHSFSSFLFFFLGFSCPPLFSLSVSIFLFLPCFSLIRIFLSLLPLSFSLSFLCRFVFPSPRAYSVSAASESVSFCFLHFSIHIFPMLLLSFLQPTSRSSCHIIS